MRTRTPPQTVNIDQLMRRNPDHTECDLWMHRSDQNGRFTGLYCEDHDHWLQWINRPQKGWLRQQGVTWRGNRIRPMIHARDIFG